MRVVLYLCLALFFLTITTFSQNSSTIKQYCQATPNNRLSNCNLTCQSCNTANLKSCESCPIYLNKSGSECVVGEKDKGYIIYQEYLTQVILKNDINLTKFVMTTGNQGKVDSNKVFRLCIANLYTLDMIGLFSTSDEIVFSVDEDYMVEKISIGFKLFFISPSVTVKIWIDNQLKKSSLIESGFETKFDSNTQQITLQNPASSWESGTMGKMERNPTQYRDLILTPVKTDMEKVMKRLFQIRIRVEDSNQTLKNWGINQFTLTKAKCRSCATQFMENLTRILGIIIGVSTALIIGCMMAICIYGRIKIMRNKQKLKNSFKGQQQSQNGDKTDKRLKK